MNLLYYNTKYNARNAKIKHYNTKLKKKNGQEIISRSLYANHGYMGYTGYMGSSVETGLATREL